MSSPIDLRSAARLILASASPRRADLLRSVGMVFDVRPSDVDETIHDGESPHDYVRRLSQEKAASVETVAGDLVVAADTTVEIDGRALGKPVDADDARSMLGDLSGRRHHVHTGVSISAASGVSTILVTTAVEFVDLDDATIEWYVGTGEPFGKAGSYAIQGAGGALVARVEGSVSNVIGLPLAETIDLLRSAAATFS